MDLSILKKIFPFSYKDLDDKSKFVTGIVIYVIVAIVTGVLIWVASMLTSWIPGAGWAIGLALSILSGLVELYTVCGIVLRVLAYTKVFNP